MLLLQRGTGIFKRTYCVPEPIDNVITDLDYEYNQSTVRL